MDITQVKLYQEPELKNPTLLAGWSGIGGIGVIAVDTIRIGTGAEWFAEILPREFMSPLNSGSVWSGVLNDTEPPTNSFYFCKRAQSDLIFFVGQVPPRSTDGLYETGKLVLDLAERFGCERVYITGAAVSQIHHTVSPKVWAVTNQEDLIEEVRACPDIIPMPATEASLGYGQELFGLHGVVLEYAKRRGLASICLLGEIPAYISKFPHIPYPKASRPIVGILTTILGIDLDLAQFDDFVIPLDESIDKWVEWLPPKTRAMIDEIRDASCSDLGEHGPITEDDQQKIMGDIDNFFNMGQ